MGNLFIDNQHPCFDLGVGFVEPLRGPREAAGQKVLSLLEVEGNKKNPYRDVFIEPCEALEEAARLEV